MIENEVSTGIRAPGLFVTTRWSVVLAAKDKGAPERGEALEILCRTYWYPLYARVRSLGYLPEDAQDLTQEFFARLLAKDYLRVVDPEKGRFRTFLRMALKRFLANEWDRRQAEKRGGGQAPLVFDTQIAEVRFQGEQASQLAPDPFYDRQWALALLEEALARLEKEYCSTGKLLEWQQCKPFLTAERGSIPYDRLAAELQVNSGAARVALHRLRKRFREVFRESVAHTVSEPGEVEAELRYVLEVLSRG